MSRRASVELPREHALGRGRQRVAVERQASAAAAARPLACCHRPGDGVEAVERQQLPALVREQVHRLDDVVEDRLADEVVEAHAREAERRAGAAEHGLRVHRRRPLRVDRIHAVDVRAGAEAAAARLDPEQVAEQRDDEVRVQHPARVADAERHDREPLERRVAEDAEVRVLAPRGERAAGEGALAPPDLLRADRLLEREHEPGADRLDDRRRARLLAHRRAPGGSCGRSG